MNQFDQYDELTAAQKDPRAVTQNIHEKHYVWYPGEDIPHPEVVGGAIFRGRVAPILGTPKWEPWEAVPEPMRTRVRGRDSMGNPTEAQYLIPAFAIFRTIMKDYEEWGVCDLTAVTDWDAKAVKELRIEEVFFPNGVAPTYDGIENQIRSTMLPSENRATYEAIAQDMLRGIEQCRRFDMLLVDENETNIEKSKSHPGYTSTYTPHSLRALKRLNRVRKDHAISQVATRQNAIVDQLPELIKGVAAQQGAGLTPEHLAAFAQAIGQQIVQGLKESGAINAQPQETPAPEAATTEQPKRKTPFRD